MNKYNDPKYNNVRVKINELIEKHGPVPEIRDLMDDPDNLSMNLDYLCRIDKICVTEEEWIELSTIEIKDRLNYMEEHLQKDIGGAIARLGEENDFVLPSNKKSNWQVFRNEKLSKELKFPEEVIKNIENDTLAIAKSISTKLIDDKPIKGLVIGGVQSGKTTNMASLMAMGADQGFNIFIILSGTIENLRMQTELRIKSLIERTSKTRTWINVPKPNNIKNERFSDFYGDNNNIYMVVLKNSTRLKNLIDWITADPDYMTRMKVLVIDDESDQASTNTSKDPEFDRKTINRLIVNLVHGIDKNNNKVINNYEAMNYIGYTATPYANILSESPGDFSLYPQNFMSVLSKSTQHFGPTQIFGVNNIEDDYLDIVRSINLKNGENNNFISKKTNLLPQEFKESIAYFLCGASSLRIHKFNKPVSMLVHMSNKIDVHNHIFESVDDWINNHKDELLDISKKVWEREIKRLTLDEVSKKVYVNKSKSLIPHSFSEIKQTLEELVSHFGYVKVEENGNYTYHNGIISSVDHSGINPSKEINDKTRLVYPELEKDKEITPIFFVIGGATLSRGLTLEGLITSYFLRTPSTADTLTQMGRWFGYRINYELYPRIWMTDNTKEQFRFISKLEEDLHEEIKSLVQSGTDFNKIGPKIMNYPQVISLTSNNKSYAMEVSEYDFTGFTTQTDKFDNDIDVQEKNVIITDDFINNLGMPIIDDETNISKVYWEKVPFEQIKDELLTKFKFNNRIKALNNIPELISWIEKVTKSQKLENWNIILGGLGKANQPNSDWELKHFKYSKVTRTKKESIYKNEIDIGVLRNPRDLYNDINLSKHKESARLIKELGQTGNKTDFDKIRDAAGLKKVPLLIIYRIDHESTPRDKTQEEADINKPLRVKLGINSDIIGLSIHIPRGDKNENYSSKVTVKITEKDDFNLNSIDVEEV